MTNAVAAPPLVLTSTQFGTARLADGRMEPVFGGTLLSVRGFQPRSFAEWAPAVDFAHDLVRNDDPKRDFSGPSRGQATAVVQAHDGAYWVVGLVTKSGEAVAYGGTPSGAKNLPEFSPTSPYLAAVIGHANISSSSYTPLPQG